MAGKKKKPSKGLAIAGLVLNILVLPGLGSLIGGRTKEGVIQLCLSILALILDITIVGLIIGIPLGVAMWVWALVTGIKMVEEAEAV